MEFPNPYNNGRGTTPLIGQQQVPTIRFEVQLTQEFMEALKEFAENTGMDGLSLVNHIINRGLAAIKQDLIYAQEEREYLKSTRPPREAPEKQPDGSDLGPQSDPVP